MLPALAGRSRAFEPPDIDILPLSDLDPFAPPDRYLDMRFLYFHSPSSGRAFTRLWNLYTKDEDPLIGEWAMVYLLPWWRSEPSRAGRIKIASIADKATRKYLANHAQAPGGHMWRAIMSSAKVATLGLLDAAHMVPDILASLDRAEQLDRDYYSGVIQAARAKLLAKAPPFPTSVGDLVRARTIVDQMKPNQSGILGAWWLVAAEIELLNGHRDRALEILSGFHTQVSAPDMLLTYSLDSSVFDAQELIRAIRSGTYSRYFFDPFFIVTRPGLDRNWEPIQYS